MSSLSDVVDQLQKQNKSMGDVRDGINALLDIQVKEVQERAEAEKDKLEAEIESANKAKASKAAAAKAAGKPTTFKGGLLAGLDTFGILGGLKNVLSSALGVASGFALGPLLGKFIGRFIVGGLGMYLGEKYLTGFMDMLIPDVVGKIKFDTIFGEKSVEEIAAALAGGIGLLFGPTLLKGAWNLIWGKPGKPTPKATSAVMNMLKKANPLRLLGTSGSAMGTMIKGLLTVKGLTSAFKKTAQWAMFVARWGMRGPLSIPLLLVGAALGLTYLYSEYMEKKRDEAEQFLKEQLKDMDSTIEEKIAAGDIEGAKKQTDHQLEILKNTVEIQNDASVDGAMINEQDKKILAGIRAHYESIKAMGGNVDAELAAVKAIETQTLGINELVMFAKKHHEAGKGREPGWKPWDQLSVEEQMTKIGIAENSARNQNLALNAGGLNLPEVLEKYRRQETARRESFAADKSNFWGRSNATLLPHTANSAPGIGDAITKVLNPTGESTSNDAAANGGALMGPSAVVGHVGDNNSYNSATSSIFPNLSGNVFDINGMIWRPL